MELYLRGPLVSKEEESVFCISVRVNAGQQYGDDLKMHVNKYGSTLNNRCVSDWKYKKERERYLLIRWSFDPGAVDSGVSE